jgi:hypothetical protein
MKLNDSGVVFNPVGHTYTLNGKMLNGITHVIKDKLFPDEYKNVPEHILKQAAIRGSEIHKIIEMYDSCSIKTNGSIELENYIDLSYRNKFLLHHIQSEYLVTDGEQYASAIDKVYEDGNGGVILADIKTTYMLNMNYVSWQLSIYKYFFKLANPYINVSGLCVIWLKGEMSAIWPVHEHSEEEVKKLLYSDEIPTSSPIVDFDEEDLIRLKKEADEAKKAYDTKKLEVQQYMVDMATKQIVGNKCKITIKEDTERISFDTKRFKDEHPDLYEQYVTKSTVKGGLLITINK